MAVSFMHIMALSAVPTVVGFTLQNFVKTDGNPRLVMMAVMSSTVLNFVLDFVFIKFFGMGTSRFGMGHHHLLHLLHVYLSASFLQFTQFFPY